MRYIIRKFVDASSVTEAMSKESSTPVHDCYLKDGEQPGDGSVSAIGFELPTEPFWRDDEIRAKRKR